MSISGLPGFRRKGMVGQLTQVAKLGCMFPVYSTIYMIAPNSEMGKFMKKPFVKFICHSTSYATFLSMFIVHVRAKRSDHVLNFTLSLSHFHSLLLFQLIRRFGFCVNPTANDIVLLGAASQRIEYLALEFIGTPWLLEILEDWKKHERGAIPGPTEFCIMIFIIST